MNWSSLHRRFLAISEKTGIHKLSSFCMSIHFTPNKEIGVELGSYDIADWPRHTYIGPYKTEEEALNATEAKIIEAEKAVEEDTL